VPHVIVVDILHGIGPLYDEDHIGRRYPTRDGDAFIHHPRWGWSRVEPGDWIMFNSNDDPGIIKPDVMAQMY
jgi:hypothetical protein